MQMGNSKRVNCCRIFWAPSWPVLPFFRLWSSLSKKSYCWETLKKRAVYIVLRKLNLDWLTFVVLSVGHISAYTITSRLVCPFKKYLCRSCRLFSAYFFTPWHPRIGDLFLGMARPPILATVQLPNFGHDRPRQLYRLISFEPCGLFDRGVCRCQNDKNIWGIEQ